MVKNLPANAGDNDQSTVWQDPTCRGTTKLPTVTTEPVSRAHAVQQETPPAQGACSLQLEDSPPAVTRGPTQAERTQGLQQ